MTRSSLSRGSITLFRRIERALETIALGSDPLETLSQSAQFLVDTFSRDLGIRGGRIFEKENGNYRLAATFGEVAKAPIGLCVPKNYPPLAQLPEVGVMVVKRDFPGLDPHLEAELGAQKRFAAISLAAGTFMVSFDLFAPVRRSEELLSTLNIMRLAINQKLREEKMMAIIEDARQIQQSILPRNLPSPGNFEIAARTLPAEIVGGDFYDVITLSDTMFDVVVADATGHGLPAALQVRDIYTGLRMGLQREFKISFTLDRLNKIINRSQMATRFVTLFLAEISRSGAVIYCNAGHPAALLVHSDGSLERLTTGGTILGPLPNSTYSVGMAYLRPGDILVLYSDGITEAHLEGSDEEFSEERLIPLLTELRGEDADTIVDRIFSAVAEFSQQDPPEDDQTVMVIKHVAD